MSRAVSYQPMHPPKKAISIEQMNAVLAKHAKKVPDVPSPPRPDCERPALRLVWRGVSAWVIETHCQRYRIEKSICPNTRKPRYRIFKRAPDWWFEFTPSEADPQVA